MTRAATATAQRRRTLTKWLFITSALGYMLLFFGYPLIRNVVMSFQDYTFSTYFTGEAPFNGLDNWRAVFANELFSASLWQTMLFTVGSLVGQFCVCMALAVFFSRRFPLSGVMRSLLLLMTRKARGDAVSVVCEVLILAVLLFPLYWMVNTALQPDTAMAELRWFPRTLELGNFQRAWESQAGNLLTSIPAAALLVVAQKYVAAGISGGSIK